MNGTLYGYASDYRKAKKAFDAICEDRVAMDRLLYDRGDGDRPHGTSEEIEAWMLLRAEQARLEYEMEHAREVLLDFVLERFSYDKP